MISYSTAISACTKSEEWKMGLGLLQEMCTRQLEPNEITFVSAIHACEIANQWEQVLFLLDEMHNMGLEPDQMAYDSAIMAFEADKKWDLALELEADRFDMLDDDLDLEEKEEAERLLEDAHGLPLGTVPGDDLQLLVDEL